MRWSDVRADISPGKGRAHPAPKRGSRPCPHTRPRAPRQNCGPSADAPHSPAPRLSERPGRRGHSDLRGLQLAGVVLPCAPGPSCQARMETLGPAGRAAHPRAPAPQPGGAPAPPAPPGLNRYPPARRSPPSGPAAGPASPRAGRRAPLLWPARRRCLSPPVAQLRAAPAASPPLALPRQPRPRALRMPGLRRAQAHAGCGSLPAGMPRPKGRGLGRGGA